jgi:hypothetical protein
MVVAAVALALALAPAAPSAQELRVGTGARRDVKAQSTARAPQGRR